MTWMMHNFFFHMKCHTRFSVEVLTMVGVNNGSFFRVVFLLVPSSCGVMPTVMHVSSREREGTEIKGPIVRERGKEK